MQKTRREWAIIFGVSYQTMTVALAGYAPRKNMAGYLFDEVTVRTAMSNYYRRKRDSHYAKMIEYSQKMKDAQERRLF